jgi:hypothetical protein
MDKATRNRTRRIVFGSGKLAFVERPTAATHDLESAVVSSKVL